MRNTPQRSLHQPSFVPAFQPGSDGIIANNSAQSQMHMGLQKLILEQGSAKKRANESDHMARRQSIVDRYNKAAGGPDIIRTARLAAALPKVASPQPVHTGLYGDKNVAGSRAKQAQLFADSFLAANKPTLKYVYDTIDIGLEDMAKRKSGLTISQKLLWSSKKKAAFFYEPLHECVKHLDRYFAKHDDPLRIRWRSVQLEPGKTKIDIYFIYPNLVDQYERGFSTWMGARDVKEF